MRGGHGRERTTSEAFPLAGDDYANPGRRATAPRPAPRQYRWCDASKNGAMLLKNEPLDEEVDFLVEGIAKEVAVIGALCDSLHDRLESICGDVDGSCSSSRQDRHGGEPPFSSRVRPHPA